MTRKKISNRERLIRVFQKKEVDRLPIRIHGGDTLFTKEWPYREDWQILYDLIEKYNLEIIRKWYSPSGEIDLKVYESQPEKENLKEIKTIIKTSKGEISRIYYQPIDNSPGYIKKYFIEDREDAERWLSLPEREKFPPLDSYWDLERKTGDRAMLMIHFEEAMCSVQALMGPELFSYWLYDERALLRQMITKSFKDIEKLLKYYLAHNIGDAYGWVGPEVCIPPLASVKDFHEFVFDYDKKIIDLIHQAGKPVWVHCHGDMAPVIGDFIEMGVDCLNPIEPPPVSKIALAQAKEICKGKMALDGGVELSAFDLLRPEEMKKLVEETVNQLEPGGSFILCPTSSPVIWPTLLPHHKENYRAFVETAVRFRDY